MLNILIVDDNSGFVAALKEVLGQDARVGDIAVAGNARDGERLVLEGAPHLAFVDVKMPGENGFELTARLRRMPKAPRVILLSLNEDAQYRQYAREAGATAFVGKSRLFAELPRIIAAALDAGMKEPQQPAPGERLRGLAAIDVLAASTEAALIVDAAGIIVYANPQLAALLGYDGTELFGQPLEVLVPAPLRATHRERRAQRPSHYRTHATAANLTVEGCRKDGATLPLSVRLSSLSADGQAYTVAFVSDLSAQTAQRQETERLTRNLILLHDCNLLTVRTQTEEALLDAICRRVSEHGRHGLTWIGLARGADASCVEVVASVGGRGELAQRDIASDLGAGMAGRAMRVRQPLVGRGAEAAMLGGAKTTAALVVPFAAAGLPGCLCVESNNGDAFTVQEIVLLQKVADDLAYGLTALRGALAQRRAEERLRLLERAVESSACAIAICDAVGPEHPILYVNPAFERISGYGADEVLGRNGRFLLDGEQSGDGIDAIRAALRARAAGTATVCCRRKHGGSFWSELSVAPVTDESGAVTHFVFEVEDVSARRLQQEEIERHANYDVLTDLPNRHLLLDRLRQAIAGALDQGRSIALLQIDIDRFALVNDAYGYHVGDLLLRMLGQRLQETVHPKDTVARIDGDEFAVMCVELAHPDDALRVVNKIRAALCAPFALPCGELTVSASMGVSLCPRDASDAESLLGQAATATRGARHEGSGQVRFYAEDMHRRTRGRLELEQHLRRALENQEFEAHYQPIVDTQSGRIVEAEALLRWRHPQRGLISPDQFIPLAEETGLIVPIGTWMIGQACRQNAAWRAAGLAPIAIGVNLSARQFREPGLDLCVAAALADSGLGGEALVLEVTESLLLADVASSAQLLRRLRLLGLKVSLDDFGTGYSSFAYLKQLPLDTLKIDRSFVRDLHTDATDAAIARCILVMAHAIGLHVVAEGVETEAQMSYLRGNGCRRVQGYLFSPPLEAARFEALLASGGEHGDADAT